MNQNDYEQFPLVNSIIPGGTPQPLTASVQPKNFKGSGSYSNGSGFTVGGASGVNVQSGQGIWAGSANFVGAPFSVDENGNLTATSANIQGTIQAGATGNDQVILSSNGVQGVISVVNASGSTVGTISVGQVSGLYYVNIQSGSGSNVSTINIFNDQISISSQSGASTAGISINPTVGINLQAGTTDVFIPPTPPTVTGSKLSNPALASLLTQLATMGLIIDATT